MIKHITTATFIILAASNIPLGATEFTAKQMDSVYNKSCTEQFSNISGSRMNFELCFAYYTSKNDTDKVIRVANNLNNLYAGSGKYLEAFDLIWQTLPFLQSDYHTYDKLKTYQKLATLYLIYHQYEQAYKYYKIAMDITQSRVTDPNKKASLLGALYNFEAWLSFEWSGDANRALELVRKSIASYSKLPSINFEIDFEHLHLAKLYVHTNQIQKAQELLSDIETKYKDQSLPIHSLLYYNIGNLNLATQNLNQAILYFKKSIAQIDLYQNHQDKKLEILEKLSECYAQKQQFELAYTYSKQAKILGNQLFGSQSTQNKTLFQIKDRYETQLKETNKQIIKNHLVILQRENELWKARAYLFTSLIILLTFSIVIIIKFQLHKYRQQKLTWEKEREEELARQRELFDHKNREITASALKLLERNQTLADVEKKIMDLSQSLQPRKLKSEILNTIQANKTKHWEAFDLSYTSANKKFISALKKKHPTLSPTELKICTFIQLGLSSKEMAELMKISVKGLNTSRSRIRRKMDLNRSVNITNYLQSIDEL